MRKELNKNKRRKKERHNLSASGRTYKKIYAVDFDGTLAVTRFPRIIRPKISMILKCKEIKRKGDILILWTCRCGKDLEDAVEYCKRYGLEFDYINENVPENIEKFGNDCRKIFAHEYIDDKAWSPDREKEFKDRLREIKIEYWKNVTRSTILIWLAGTALCMATIVIMKYFNVI